MCMLFICTNPSPSPDEFSLIVTSIRDEYFKRPTGLCQFWDSNPNIIGGIDLQEGREGGTWFAMNPSGGKIAALLNILQPIDKVCLGKQHRGFLVPQFLDSQLDGPQFLASLMPRSSQYADFLMVTIDVSEPWNASPVTSYFTNMDQTRNQIFTSSQGVLAFGNNLPGKPWIKTVIGKRMFENITKRNMKIKKKKSLINELFAMMDDDTQYFPDEQLLSDGRGYNRTHLEQLSAIKVKIPSVGFGSRTQSIILIDQKRKVDFIEKTINESVLQSGRRSSSIPSPSSLEMSLEEPPSFETETIPSGRGRKSNQSSPSRVGTVGSVLKDDEIDAIRQFSFRIPFTPNSRFIQRDLLLPLPLFSLSSRL